MARVNLIYIALLALLILMIFKTVGKYMPLQRYGKMLPTNGVLLQTETTASPESDVIIESTIPETIEASEAVKEVEPTAKFRNFTHTDTNLPSSPINTNYTDTRFDSSPPAIQVANESKQFSGLEGRRHTQHTGGYILSHDYWEQLTSASRNMLSLQCWANRIASMAVVEPFLKKSYLQSPTTQREASSLRFSDIYDINHWNSLSWRNRYAPLITWEEFLERAPRNLITVDIKYGAVHQLPLTDKRLYMQDCSIKSYWTSMASFLQKKHNFHVIRKICINFSHDKEFSFDEFRAEIFKDHTPSTTTVLFNQWRGLGNKRIQVRDSGCGKITANVEAEPSKRVIEDAEKYIARYLGTYDYIAILARMEKVKMADGKELKVTSCFQQTLKYWDKMAQKNVTFLSADVGRYGSDSLRHAKDDLTGVFQEFFDAIYGSKWTVSQWERTFVSVSGLSDPGYIGMLQKVLASRAKCVLFVGGGSFQRSALHLYHKRHSVNNWCINSVTGCMGDKL